MASNGIAPGPREEDTDEAFRVGPYALASAVVQEIIGRRERGKPEPGPDKPLYQAVGIGRKFIVGFGHGPAVAIVAGHPAHLDYGECGGHFPTEGVDAGPEGSQFIHWKVTFSSLFEGTAWLGVSDTLIFHEIS